MNVGDRTNQKDVADKHLIEEALGGGIADADKLKEGDSVSPSEIRETA